jgi:hypothetical protein
MFWHLILGLEKNTEPKCTGENFMRIFRRIAVKQKLLVVSEFMHLR